ncbi:hypothetical protein H257_04306 [Aphanomyces astaci]|uniref:Uncharacterized protein n=1 Tax=Aphanomyces astaci TaxID=112090 RepID=W4GX89_APHAT|nr:hypothetical protein H257_04306 [Aphanomyces astaci]ETV83614.1 hypothetical protein H257_04306 [Aphanomyces astaci]|eukprot:XP_009827044.1 hypothetical protein H257_04306 [Aphanomyces astaci]
MELKAVDIVGVSSGEGTRSCTCHDICGDSLTVDDLVVCRLEVQGESGNLEEVLKVFRLVASEQACHVGFLPLRLLKKKEDFANKIAIIVEDYRTSPSKYQRQRSERNVGIVKAVIMEHLQEYHQTSRQ